MTLDPETMAKLVRFAREELDAPEGGSLQDDALDQERLVPPKTVLCDNSQERCARYAEAFKAMTAELKKLSFVETPATNGAKWLAHPNVLRLSLGNDTFGAPAFQFKGGKPIELVMTVNAWIAYGGQRRMSWGNEPYDRLLWWFLENDELGHPPIDLLGTAREKELESLATPKSLRA